MWWIATLALAGAPADESTPIAAHMQAHFYAASRAAWFVAAGDVAEAQRAAAELDHDDPFPDPWRRYGMRMRRAARGVQRAEPVSRTAMRVARLGQACADCHTSIVGGPRMTESQLDGLTGEDDHAIAWFWMWNGLVMGEGRAWANGARTDVVPPAAEGTAAHAADYAVIIERASQATERQRARRFGELTQTCAACHATAGVDIQRSGPPQEP